MPVVRTYKVTRTLVTEVSATSAEQAIAKAATTPLPADAEVSVAVEVVR